MIGIKIKFVDGGLDPKIFVREMLPGEERTIRELFKRSIGPIDRLIFLLAFREALLNRGAAPWWLCARERLLGVSL